MTNHRAGKTNRRDPRPWTMGKREKANTSRYLRRITRKLTRNGRVD